VNRVVIAQLFPQYSAFMKKLIGLLVLGAIAVYGIGRFNLGEAGAMRFMTKMESLMNEGKSEEVCAMFDDDLEVEIADHSGESTQKMSGGKKEFCELTATTIAGLQLLPHTMNVEYTGVTAKNGLSKPWTSDVSYSEHRTFNIPSANVSMLTVSDDEITLIQTFSGVKLRRIKSEVYKADAT
jgi:hypothetical protein